MSTAPARRSRPVGALGRDSPGPAQAERQALAFGGPLILKSPDAGPAEHAPASYEATLAYLDAQAPDLARLTREISLPERAQRQVSRFFASLFASSERFRLARAEAHRLRRAL